jgi:anti-repressor protein
MTEVARFEFNTLEVRTVVRDGDPWFVAKDVCSVLGIANPSDAVRSLDDDEVALVPAALVTTDARPQDFLNLINEPGLYSLILRSRKPEAKAFKRWITHEVIPAIRRTGRYDADPDVTVAAIGRRELAMMVIEAEDRAVAAELALADAAPKAEAWEHLASADGDYAVADAAKILSRHPLITVGRDRLFTLMGRDKWVYRREADRRWTVYQYAVDRSWLTERASSHYHPRTGELVLDAPQVRVTAKGLAELQRRLTGTQVQIEAAGVPS